MKKWFIAILTAVIAMLVCSTLIVLFFGNATATTLLIGAAISYYTGLYMFNNHTKIFHGKIKDKIESPFLGGDGSSMESPVYINCASGSMAETLIDRFISERHGEKDIDWNVGISFTHKSNNTKCGMVKSIVVNTKQGDFTYYFDLSRPFKTLEKFLQRDN